MSTDYLVPIATIVAIVLAFSLFGTVLYWADLQTRGR